MASQLEVDVTAFVERIHSHIERPTVEEVSITAHVLPFDVQAYSHAKTSANASAYIKETSYFIETLEKIVGESVKETKNASSNIEKINAFATTRVKTTQTVDVFIERFRASTKIVVVAKPVYCTVYHMINQCNIYFKENRTEMSVI